MHAPTLHEVTGEWLPLQAAAQALGVAARCGFLEAELATARAQLTAATAAPAPWWRLWCRWGR
jgi:hypothetical protein